MHKRRIISLLIVLSIIISSGITAFAQPTDTINHWAENSINYMMSKQILNGYPDGDFRPNGSMTKAEFYKVINGLLGYEEKSDINFLDVMPGSWYYEEVQKAIAAGYINDSALLTPDAKITREEVARIIGTVFHLSANEDTAISFLDSFLINEEAKGYIGALKAAGFINGYPDGTFGPQREITRAEVVTMLGNMSGEIINTPGVFSQDIPNNMIITQSGVRLENMTIAGDLYVTEGIGVGDIILNNVTVLGTVYIWGGGTPGVKIIDSNINKIDASRKSRTVLIELENSDVDQMMIGENILLEVDGDSSIDTLEVEAESTISLAKGSRVNYLEVNGENVLIEGKGNIRRLKANQRLMVNRTRVNKGTTEEVTTGEVVRERDDRDRDERPVREVITNINNISKTVKQNEEFSLPNWIPAEIDRYYTSNVSVRWIPVEADTSKVGTFTFEGRVAGYSRIVYLTLNVVKDESIVQISAISVDQTTLTLTAGGATGTITATVLPADATNKTVTWTSSNEAVATVAGGVVTPLTAGTTTITATTVDRSFTATTTVIVLAEDTVAIIDTTQYDTLEDAVATVLEDETITLVDNASGNGIIVPSNAKFTLDLGGFTYTVDKKLVGSSGTETNGFQLLRDSTITIKNGGLITTNAKMLIQNYSNLTLDNVELTGASMTQYVLSNNNGKTTLTNGTTITATEGNVAFDVYYWPTAGYESVSVEILTNDVVIEGTVEYASDGTGDFEAKAALIIPLGYELDAPTGYEWVVQDGKQVLIDASTVAMIGPTQYDSLKAAINAAENGSTINVIKDCTLIGATANNKDLTFVGNSSKPKIEFPQGKDQPNYQTYYGCEFTFENLTLDFDTTHDYHGIQPDKLVIKNSVINGELWGYAKDIEIVDSTLHQETVGYDYNIWTYGSNVTLTNTTVYSLGRSILVYNEGATKDIPAKITINNSKFINTGDVVSEKAAIEISTQHGGSFEVVINNSTAEGFDIKTATGGIVLSEGLANLKYIGTGTLTVTIDGKQVLADGLTYDAASDTYEISNANGLVYANENLFNINLSNNKYKLGADIDMSDVTDWNSNVSQTTHFELDGGGYKISGLKTTSDALLVPRSQYTVTIKNLTLENCEVNTASEYAAMLVGYADANTVTIDNCNVINGKVQGANYAGALIGWSSKDININSSSVENTSILGGGSTGGIVGHCVGDESGIANITDVTIEDCTIKGEKVEKSGIVVGTANVGKTTITTNSIVNNTVFEIENSDAIYGRFVPSTTGELTVNSTTIN